MRAAEPLTVTEAVSALAAEGARCVAGGQSLVAMMNAGLVSPDVLVSLRRVQGLDGVAWTSDGELVVGAMTRHRDVARIVPRGAASALLVAAAQRIGHPAIRNQGTIGGSIAHADPAADMPTAIVCADAEVEIAGRSGTRRVPARSFFQGYYETACGAGELVTAIRVPAAPAGAVAHYEKLMIVDGDFAVVSVALILRVSGDVCMDVRIALGAVAPTPLRLHDAERLLIGSSLDDEAVARAAARLADAADPLDDMRGSAVFRRRLIPRLLRRAIAAARAGTGGSRG